MIKLLKHFALFKDFNEEGLTICKNYCRLKTYGKEQIVINRNRENKEFFIVVTGKIISTLTLPSALERKHEEFLPGDFFGEIYLFGERPLFNTYMASEISDLLVIKKTDFKKFIKDYPDYFITFVSTLLSLIIRKFRKSSKFLADVVEWGEKASRRVITDELTGIYNRAFLDDALLNFFNISKSNEKPLSVLMLDIDNFRIVNEAIDMKTGNKILSQVVAIINSLISKKGIMARYGGDEFTILLPEIDLSAAVKIAENIRKEIAAHDFSNYTGMHDIKITISIGISNYPETATDLETFKRKADKALYKAKEAGRNKVCYFK